jgi:hypothetical protein
MNNFNRLLILKMGRTLGRISHEIAAVHYTLYHAAKAVKRIVSDHRVPANNG